VGQDKHLCLIAVIGVGRRIKPAQWEKDGEREQAGTRAVN